MRSWWCGPGRGKTALPCADSALRNWCTSIVGRRPEKHFRRSTRIPQRNSSRERETAQRCIRVAVSLKRPRHSGFCTPWTFSHPGLRAQNGYPYTPNVRALFSPDASANVSVAARSEHRQTRPVPALTANLRTEGHRQFKQSRDRRCASPLQEPACCWRYRRIAAGRPAAALAQIGAGQTRCKFSCARPASGHTGIPPARPTRMTIPQRDCAASR